MPWPFIDERDMMRRPNMSGLTQIPLPLPEGFGGPSRFDRAPRTPVAPTPAPKTGRLPEAGIPSLGWSPEIQEQSDMIQKQFGAGYQGPPPPPGDSGGGISDWFKENMPETYRIWTGEPATTEPVDEPSADEVPADPVLPETAPVPEFRPEATPPEAAPAPTPQAPTLEEEIAERRALIERIFPQRDTGMTPGQQQAQDYAMQERNRAQLMAQLAFASGLTAAGGGNWKNVASGLAAAGGAYSEGFKRYHDALVDYGNLQMKQREAQYERDLGVSQAAYESVTGERQAASKAGREAVEKRRKEFMDFFKEIKPEADELGAMDPAERERWERLFEYFMATGTFIPPGSVDVRNQE